MPDATTTAILSFITGRYPQAPFREDQDIFSLGFINSLFAMELVMFLEREFSIAIPNDLLRIDNFRTVKAMAELVGRLRSATVA
jgi:acyl carrier protein